MTKRQLYQHHNEISNWERNGSIFMTLLSGRIKDFYKDFHERIESILSDIQLIQREYFVIENDTIQFDGEGATRTVRFLPGRTQADYDFQWHYLMNQDIMHRFQLQQIHRETRGHIDATDLQEGLNSENQSDEIIQNEAQSISVPTEMEDYDAPTHNQNDVG